MVLKMRKNSINSNIAIQPIGKEPFCVYYCSIITKKCSVESKFVIKVVTQIVFCRVVTVNYGKTENLSYQHNGISLIRTAVWGSTERLDLVSSQDRNISCLIGIL